MKFKLIVLDLDGTTLKSDLTISCKLKDVMRRIAKDFRINITIATGRMFAMCKKYINDLFVNVPVITLNGVEIIDHKDGKTINYWPIENDIAEYIRDILWKFDGSALAISREQVYLSRFTDVALGSIRDWFATPVIGFPPDNAQYLCFFAIGTYEELKDMADRIETEYPRDVSIDIFPSLRYNPLSYLEIRAGGVSKGRGLRYLKEYLGIKKEDVFAIGDWTNDITLFEEAGFSATLANGAPQLKQIANIISPYTNNEDGVAHLIEKIFWEKEDSL